MSRSGLVRWRRVVNLFQKFSVFVCRRDRLRVGTIDGAVACECSS